MKQNARGLRCKKLTILLRTYAVVVEIFLLHFVMSTLTSVTSILNSEVLTDISLNTWAISGEY